MTDQEIIGLAPDQLVIEPRYQARERIDRQHVERLRHSDPEQWEPLLVRPLGDGRYAILDGAHRFEAGKQLPGNRRVTTYPCRVLPDGGYGDSFDANADRPLSLSVGDRKRYAYALHRAHPSLSVRECAR